MNIQERREAGEAGCAAHTTTLPTTPTNSWLPARTARPALHRGFTHTRPPPPPHPTTPPPTPSPPHHTLPSTSTHTPLDSCDRPTREVKEMNEVGRSSNERGGSGGGRRSIRPMTRWQATLLIQEGLTQFGHPPGTGLVSWFYRWHSCLFHPFLGAQRRTEAGSRISHKHSRTYLYLSECLREDYSLLGGQAGKGKKKKKPPQMKEEQDQWIIWLGIFWM